MNRTRIFGLAWGLLVACGPGSADKAAPVANNQDTPDVTTEREAPVPVADPAPPAVNAPANTPPSEAASPPNTASPSETRAVPVTDSVRKLAADPTKSHVRFLVLKATGEHALAFGRFRGHLSLDGDTISALEVEVDTPSLITEPAAFRMDVLSAAFLHAKKYPQATFRSTRIEPVASDPTQLDVDGVLTIRGVKKPVRFPIAVEFGDEVIRGRGKLPFEVDDFGIRSPAIDAEMVDPKITLDIALTFVQPKAGTTTPSP